MNEFDTILLTRGDGTNIVEIRTDRAHKVFNVVSHTPEGDKDHGTFISQPFAIMIYTAVVKTLFPAAA